MYTLPCGDEIVISGISGRLPNSSNIEEFEQQLFNGTDMISNENGRWPKGMYGLHDRIGKIKDIDLKSFDMNFFEINKNQADNMDPMNRMLLEATYEAIIDAGHNPEELKGTRCGVYVGATVSMGEIERYYCRNVDMISGDARLGCCFFMYANRISFAFDLKGPSYAVDCACAGSLFAFTNAFQDMANGYVDSAIVCGTLYVHSPLTVLQLDRLGVLSTDGYCKPFDHESSGYVPSDACTVLFLQRKSIARRAYAQVLGARHSNDGTKPEGIAFPVGRMHSKLYKDLYEIMNVSPKDVVYVEAHGTGTKAGDDQELSGISQFFRQDGDTSPLLIGSLKSNMGHSESAAGVTSIVKLILAMQNGIIPGNINFNKLEPRLFGNSNRLKIVSENTAWNGGIVGLNSFGLGGDNVHAVLKSYGKTKCKEEISNLPRLVFVSGRTTNAVDRFLKYAQKNHRNQEYLALLNEIHKIDIPKHFFRGYLLIENDTIKEDIQEIHLKTRPIWFIYAGLGSQWTGMGKSMMHLKSFSDSIHKSTEILHPFGVNLIECLTSGDESLLKNKNLVFVSITAIQIALTDVLMDIGINPDGYIGHSFGELGCAYADGCLSRKETILAAYFRGKCISDNYGKLIPGSMAAIGLPWEQCEKELPDDVFVACHNSKDNTTISGPTVSVLKAVEQLQQKQIFAKIVNSLNIAAHSKYIKEVLPDLQEAYEKIVTKPKNRSSKWITSSIPLAQWSNSLAQQCSVEYLLNNIENPVLFREACDYIPENAICIEIAPHGLLQAILKRSLNQKNITNISVMKMNNENNVSFFLENIGKLYNAGGQPNIIKLYPKIEYPVSQGTPMLNSAVEWDHNLEFEIPKLPSLCPELDIEVNLDWDIYAHLTVGRSTSEIYFGAAHYIVIAWKALSNLSFTGIENIPIILKNVKILRETIIPPSKTIRFTVYLLHESNNFEIFENGKIVASGQIEKLLNKDVHAFVETTSEIEYILNSREITTELRLRGQYFTEYKDITKADLTFTHGTIRWNGWMDSFLEAMLNFHILGINERAQRHIQSIDCIKIDPFVHKHIIGQTSNELQINVNEIFNNIICGGIELSGIYSDAIPLNTIKQNDNVVLEHFEFIPYFNKWKINDETNVRNAITILLQIIFENGSTANKQFVDLIDSTEIPENSISDLIFNLLKTEPNIIYNINIYSKKIQTSYNGIEVTNGTVSHDSDVAIGYNLYGNENVEDLLKNLMNFIRNDGFIFLISKTMENLENICNKLELSEISNQQVGDRFYILLRRKIDLESKAHAIISITSKHYNWIEDVKKELSNENNSIVYLVVNQGEREFGATGLLKCLRFENNGFRVRLVHSEDNDPDQFSIDHPKWKDQLAKDLSINIYKNMKWGSYRHLKLNTNPRTPVGIIKDVFAAPVTTDDQKLKWIENEPIEMDEEKCTIYYSGINQSDLNRLTKSADGVGVEFSGRDLTGNRVMGLLPTKSLATSCKVMNNLLWKIPSNWTLEEAATVPYSYSIAYYALSIQNHLRNGQSILILNGTSCIGQAAINIAFELQLNIFTVVQNAMEKELLKSLWPSLKLNQIWTNANAKVQNIQFDNIFNSSFVCDATLFSKYLRKNGRLLQLTKNHNQFNVSSKFHLTSYIDFDAMLLCNEHSEDLNELKRLIENGIEKGIVKPIKSVVFNADELDEAFERLKEPELMEKIVIQMRAEENERSIGSTVPKLIKAIRRTYFLSEKSYIITGGLGGLGLEIAYWMISRGAKNIILVSRNGITTGYQSYMLQRFKCLGAAVIVYEADVSDYNQMENCLNVAQGIGQIDGIFHLAGILKDNLLENQSPEQFTAVALVKTKGIENLDRLSRKMCPKMEHFVCASSIVGGRGGIGQTNYGMANSAMEKTCEQRQLDGLSAKAIQWGLIDDTGMITKFFGKYNGLVAGTSPQRVSSMLETLDFFMHQPYTILTSFNIVQTNLFGDSNQKFGIVDRIAKTLLSKDISEIKDSETLENIGLDSIMVTQVKQMIEKLCNISLNLDVIRKMTLKDLENLENRN